jgi:hypothetical protein
MSKTVKPWDLLNSNKKRSDKLTADERFSICKGCPQFIKLSNQCKKCGCFMQLKTKLEDAECPIGRW